VKFIIVWVMKNISVAMCSSFHIPIKQYSQLISTGLFVLLAYNKIVPLLVIQISWKLHACTVLEPQSCSPFQRGEIIPKKERRSSAKIIAIEKFSARWARLENLSNKLRMPLLGKNNCKHNLASPNHYRAYKQRFHQINNLHVHVLCFNT